MLQICKDEQLLILEQPSHNEMIKSQILYIIGFCFLIAGNGPQGLLKLDKYPTTESYLQSKIHTNVIIHKELNHLQLK